MIFRVLLSPKSQRFLNKLKNKEDKKRIENKLRELKQNPELGKPLVGKLSGLWTIRFGKYRVMYNIRKSELLVLVLKLGHRKNVYS